jgi:hypothetical protein
MHPMYKKPEGPNLWQGDILDFVKLKPALEGHQDYIAQQKHFLGFCVITQTCDLIRDPANKRDCASFINLAVIRRLLDPFCANDVRSNSVRDRTSELLRDIIKHNENKRGYFFLPSEPSAGIAEDSVVDLRVMVSLYAEFHYEQMLSARIGALNDVYANKLGWMVGQLFSRVPAPDWDEWGLGETAKKRVERFIDNIRERPEARLP